LQICDRESFPNKAQGSQQATGLLLSYGNDALEQKLDHYRYHKANTMDDLLWYMLNSLTNKISMKATVGDIDLLEPYLFNFDPYQTQGHYQDDWKKLFKKIRDNVSPPGAMNEKILNSFWVIFTKGILSGA